MGVASAHDNDTTAIAGGDVPNFRATHLFPPRSLTVTAGDDGSLLLSSGPQPVDLPLSVPGLVAERAAQLGDKSFIAERGADGEWQHTSYAEFKRLTDAVGAWLRARGRGDDRILIVTANSTNQAILTYGAATGGVPVCPVSAQYALSPTGSYGRLEHVVGLLEPTLVFAEKVAPIAGALRQVLPDGVEVIATDPEAWPGAISWDEIVAAPVPDDFDATVAAIDPNTVWRYMLTSGSTGLPKLVTQTNRMWTALVDSARSIIGEASGWSVRTMDWMPWSHVSGASVLIGALGNGGTFYLDDGRPTPALFEKTLRNLAEVKPLFFANVPYAFGMLCDALEADAALREAFFAELQLCLYGGAGLAQPVYDRFQKMAEETIGERIMFTTGYGCTEATAGVMSISWPTTKVGVGLPMPGVDVKLVPLDAERYEVRFRGECVMPGYLDNPEANARAFDDEGFYRTGDAIAFIDPDDPEEGFVFSGRLAEEFKLSTGTFVPGGRLHNEILAATSPVALENLVCGEGRDELGLLLWLNPAGVSAVLGVDGTPEELAADQRVIDWLTERLRAASPRERGSAGHFTRFAILTAPPDVDAGEMSDKGSINQSISLRRRQADVEALYAGGPGVHLLA